MFFRKTILLLLALITLVSCSDQQVKIYRVGVAQLGDEDAWRKEMKAEMERELVFHPEIRLNYKQADYNSATQVSQIRELLNAGIDALIVSANEAEPLTPIIDSVYALGIPVITVDRNINSDAFTSFIGADNEEVGQLAAQYIAGHLGRKGSVLQITGLPSSTPAKQREKGFNRVMKTHPAIQVVTVHGNWLEASVEKILPQMKDQLGKTDLIFAHNDVMAKTADSICKSMGLQHIRAVGVDAQPGTGLNFIQNNQLLASVLYPTGGAEAIRTAARIAQQQAVPKRDILSTFIVDSNNVVMLQQQVNKIVAQQKDIVRQNTLLQQQAKTFRSQRNLIFILVATISLLLMVSALLIYQRRKNILTNKLLRKQNDEIIVQSRQINSMAEQVQEASEQRINFFTNVSHELKTPLTLILAPTEEMLKNPKLPPYIRSQFQIIRKSASRLLLLVNQLMDFRKLELNKADMDVQEIDLIPFIHHIIGAFDGLAKQRDIDCRLFTREPSIIVWIDPEKIEKVFFNLLSNAFKFTADSGKIYVHVEQDAMLRHALIKIEDTGYGLSKMDQERLFEFFYQGNTQSRYGTGIGLALSKELLELHKGTITVESEKNRGSAFTITLPLGKAHFNEKQLKPSEKWGYSSEMNAWIADYRYSIDMPVPAAPDDLPQPLSDERKHTILVVEDNEDLSQFLIQKLKSHYHIVSAADGTDGIRKAFEELPDLIISDIMMPSTDGLQLTKMVKTDLRTAHIPIILLTAKTTDENRIEGLRHQADAYITKPFHFPVIEETIANLLQNRQRVTSHISVEIPKEINETTSKTDKAFFARFTAFVEQHIANENLSVQDICSNLGVSKIQLYRKIKPLINSGINEYILQQRIQKAKQLLQNENLSLAEVAAKTGFSTPSYFSACFKKATGTTPKAYKTRFGNG